MARKPLSVQIMVLLLFAFCLRAEARVVRFVVERTRIFAEGISFGTVGPYQRLDGTAYMEVRRGSWSGSVSYWRRTRSASSARPRTVTFCSSEARSESFTTHAQQTLVRDSFLLKTRQTGSLLSYIR